MRTSLRAVFGVAATGAVALFLLPARRPLLAWPHADGRLSAVAAMHARRSSHTATLLPDGRVLIAGGMLKNGVFLASAEVFDPAARRFAPIGDMPTPRISATATRLADGRVLIAGGSDRPFHHLASAVLFDPATDRFQATGSLLAPRASAQAERLADGRVLIVGGTSDSDWSYVATAELYDPRTGTFSATGNMRLPRSAFAMCELADGRVLVAGGSIAGRYPHVEITKAAELYDPRSGRFETTGSMATPRHKHAAVLLRDGRALVLGGSDDRDWRGKYASAELYDPAKGTFLPVEDMREARFKLTRAVVRLDDGRVLIAGGAGHPELFDPVSLRFELVAGPELDGRYFSTATRLANGQVLLAGGYGEHVEPSENQAWLFQP
jgi:alkylated DNA repair dioxygenase AlkB